MYAEVSRYTSYSVLLLTAVPLSIKNTTQMPLSETLAS